MNKVHLLFKFAHLYSLAAQGLVSSLEEAARILSVNVSATPEQINKAFREKAKKSHPDVNPNGDLEMKLLNSARELLLSSEEEYDDGDDYEDSSSSSNDIDEMMFDTKFFHNLTGEMEKIYKPGILEMIPFLEDDGMETPSVVYAKLWEMMNDKGHKQNIADDNSTPEGKRINHLLDGISNPEFTNLSVPQVMFLKKMAWGYAMMDVIIAYKNKHRIK